MTARSRSWLSFKRNLSRFALMKVVGRWAHRGVYLTSIILLFVSLVGGITVVGLLQSTERVGTSGIIIMPPPPPPKSPPSSPPPPPPPPPEPAVEIDIYSDSGCTTELLEIVWGSVEAGGFVSEAIYIMNSGDQGITLSLSTENWVPAEASDYMELSWDYDGSHVGAGDVVEVTLTLTIDSSITGVDSFSFDIVIIGYAS